jgi:hypothetical protein
MQECIINGYEATVKGTYDWGVHLDIKIESGEPARRGVEVEERYIFVPQEKKWFALLGPLLITNK